MWRWRVALAVIAIVAAGCSDAATGGTERLGESIAPTQAAMDANAEFLAVPNGYADCGATVLTSGWPTTTSFNSEISARCIIDAADRGEPAQYAYWGRDGSGGISGVIIRVTDLSPLTITEYGVDGEGRLDSVEEPCVQLETTMVEPPRCASG